MERRVASVKPAWLAAVSLTLLAAAWLGFQSCSSDEAATRTIRAHDTMLQGVAHAEPKLRPERYCSACHGAGLAGGSDAQPSCYQCHGKNWTDASDSLAAPATHTLEKTLSGRSYFHDPGLLQPAANCAQASCHGSELGGTIESGATRPGCELCHERLWETRGT